MARVFAAFALSDPARIEVARVGATLPAGVRRVGPDALHVTLAFLGERGDVPAITEALAGAAATCAPARIRLDAVGGFPIRARAHTIFVGVADRSGDLARAATTLRDALVRAPVSWRPDRSFVPHITVGRARPATTVPAAEVAPVVFEIAAVQVMGSVLRGSRPAVYTVLADLPFGA